MQYYRQDDNFFTKEANIFDVLKGIPKTVGEWGKGVGGKLKRTVRPRATLTAKDAESIDEGAITAADYNEYKKMVEREPNSEVGKILKEKLARVPQTVKDEAARIASTKPVGVIDDTDLSGSVRSSADDMDEAAIFGSSSSSPNPSSAGASSATGSTPPPRRWNPFASSAPPIDTTEASTASSSRRGRRRTSRPRMSREERAELRRERAESRRTAGIALDAKLENLIKAEENYQNALEGLAQTPAGEWETAYAAVRDGAFAQLRSATQEYNSAVAGMRDANGHRSIFNMFLSEHAIPTDNMFRLDTLASKIKNGKLTDDDVSFIADHVRELSPDARSRLSQYVLEDVEFTKPDGTKGRYRDTLTPESLETINNHRSVITGRARRSAAGPASGGPAPSSTFRVTPQWLSGVAPAIKDYGQRAATRVNLSAQEAWYRWLQKRVLSQKNVKLPDGTKRPMTIDDRVAALTKIEDKIKKLYSDANWSYDARHPRRVDPSGVSIDPPHYQYKPHTYEFTLDPKNVGSIADSIPLDEATVSQIRAFNPSLATKIVEEVGSDGKPLYKFPVTPFNLTKDFTTANPGPFRRHLDLTAGDDVMAARMQPFLEDQMATANRLQRELEFYTQLGLENTEAATRVKKQLDAFSAPGAAQNDYDVLNNLWMRIKSDDPMQKLLHSTKYNKVPGLGRVRKRRFSHKLTREDGETLLRYYPTQAAQEEHLGGRIFARNPGTPKAEYHFVPERITREGKPIIPGVNSEGVDSYLQKDISVDTKKLKAYDTAGNTLDLGVPIEEGLYPKYEFVPGKGVVNAKNKRRPGLPRAEQLWDELTANNARARVLLYPKWAWNRFVRAHPYASTVTGLTGSTLLAHAFPGVTNTVFGGIGYGIGQAVNAAQSAFMPAKKKKSETPTGPGSPTGPGTPAAAPEPPVEEGPKPIDSFTKGFMSARRTKPTTEATPAPAKDNNKNDEPGGGLPSPPGFVSDVSNAFHQQLASWAPDLANEPYAHSVGGAAIGALTGLGLGAVSHFLGDATLSEEEKKRRSLLRSMLSGGFAGLTAGGLLGGIDDFRRA